MINIKRIQKLLTDQEMKTFFWQSSIKIITWKFWMSMSK